MRAGYLGALHKATVTLNETTGAIDTVTIGSEITIIKEPSADLSRDQIEANYRINKEWNSSIAGRRNFNLSFTLAIEPGNADFEYIDEAADGNTSIGLAFLYAPNGDTGVTTNWGHVGLFRISNYNVSQTDVQEIEVEAVLERYAGKFPIATGS